MRSARSPVNPLLRDLPSIDELLRTDTARRIAVDAGENHLTELARRVVDHMRIELRSSGDELPGGVAATCEQRLADVWQAEVMTGTQRVINATGVIIHTNLGRAPLSADAQRAVAEQAGGYCTLEYDLATGKRGKRGPKAEEMLAGLTGAESVLIVNNCAAAAFFVLTVFAAGGEVVISRGELVEIGGDFRVPDVLSQSGAILHEVGTTNRTKLSDYESAINSKTKLILRVHPSNYRIVGYTAMPSVADLSALASKHGLMLYEDTGSGAIIDLNPAGLGEEPVSSASIRDGADIITFSGDKLLGGPQAGIIAGKREYIDRLRRHPLYRALRVGRNTYAALEATLGSYRRETAMHDIPVLRMLAMSKQDIAARLEKFTALLSGKLSGSGLVFETVDGVSATGGGAAPSISLDTRLLALSHDKLSARTLEERLRNSRPPVITRIVDDRLMIDLRTVAEAEEPELINAVLEIS